MKRSFYFLRDSVSKQFYTGFYTQIDRFERAAVYFTREEVEEKLKKLINKEYTGSWENLQRGLPHYDKRCKKAYKKDLELVNERKNLKDWGIEIIEVEISL